MDLGYKGKRCLITASTGGLGLAIAQSMAAEGATVVVNGRSSESVKKAAARITAADGRDRPGNQRKAFERLRPKLEAWIRAQIGEKVYPRSDEVVRTYHEVDNRVNDHATGEQIAWSEKDKKLDDLIRSRAHAVRRGLVPPKQSGRT